MRSLDKKVADLKWVHGYRLLKQRKSEQDARGRMVEADAARSAHEAAKNASQSALKECLGRAAAGQAFDPILDQLWRAELSRCEREQGAALTTLNEAEHIVEAATMLWRQSITIADRANEDLATARRQLSRAKEQLQLADAEERLSQRASQS
ncbi:MAG: hypothetical protein RL481_1602 [Pseudomonadota bacterium]|jgi:hypothetical protein